MMVKGRLVLWSNFQGLSIIDLTVYLTWPVESSNEDGSPEGS